MHALCRWKTATLLTLLTLGLDGCGVSSLPDALAPASENVTLSVREPDARGPIVREGDLVDSLEVNGYDESGQRIVGPLRAPVAENMTFPRVPRRVSALKIDYLRNGGVPLYRAIVRLPSGEGATSARLGSDDLAIEDPQQSPQASPTSSFRFETLPGTSGTNPANVDGYQLIATYPDNSTLDNPPTDHPIMLQGVCYAPSPIGYDSGDGPALSDLFWDSYPGANGMVYGWQVLWGLVSNVPPPTVFRDDIDTIRNTLQCNAIRVYAMMSQQLDSSGTAFGSQVFTHEQFLDYCFNNGNDPVFVLIGFPTPAFDFQQSVTPSPPLSAAWRANMTGMIAEVGPQPAVLGWTIMNELDQVGASTNANGNGDPLPSSSATDYFYDAAQTYIQLFKNPFPNKLVGWAAHDSPQLLDYMANYANTQTNVLYAEQVTTPGNGLYGFDFWGVNTYQAASLDTVLGPTSIPNGLTFSQLPAAYRLPVIFTEIGYPAAEHVTDDGPLQESATAQGRAAEVLTRVFTEAYSNAAPPSPNPAYSPNPPDYVAASTPISVPYPELLVGTFYFEFSDEWDKGGDGGVDSNGNWSWNANSTADPNRPNGYDDEAAFGLYSLALPSGAQPNRNPYPPDNGAPAAPVDTLTARTPLVDAITSFYQQQFMNPGTPGTPP